MKKLTIILIFFFINLNISLLHAYSSNPKDFVSELVNDAISKLSVKI